MLGCPIVVGHDSRSNQSRSRRRDRREVVAVGRECGLLGEPHAAERRLGDPEVVRRASGVTAVLLFTIGKQRCVTVVKLGEPIGFGSREDAGRQRSIRVRQAALALFERAERLRPQGRPSSTSRCRLIAGHALNDAAAIASINPLRGR